MKYEYKPDYITHPGETLVETLEALNISKVQLAVATGISLTHIDNIADGKELMTAEESVQLEKVLGVPATLWNAMVDHYRNYRKMK
jgi:HTH-type transcriptional regulator/antitoxin HigA